MRSDLSTLLPGLRAVWYDEVGSTQDIARELAAKGERNLWVCARRQSAGRGTRGRDWVSPEGNLHATLIAGFPLDLRRVTQAHICAGVAVREAVAAASGEHIPSDALTLKWPNDNLLMGCKYSGLLIETAGEGVDTFLIGVGINCNNAPEKTNFPATSLAEHGLTITPEELLPHLARAIARWLTPENLSDNFASAHAQFIRHAAMLGQNLTVRDRSGGILAEGVFCGLDADGLIVLKVANNSYRGLSVGEIL
jgi:BirA family transcriptional regulator, biotin operon repressor / biotin---[acetyl-CoA-carboxylase] ligase